MTMKYRVIGGTEEEHSFKIGDTVDFVRKSSFPNAIIAYGISVTTGNKITQHVLLGIEVEPIDE